MTGFAHDVAGGNGNLVIPSVQSPNFVHGSAGWQVRKDGSVEFNNGTFRGTVTAGVFQGTDFIINAAGEFFYSGTPALGNLSASVVPGTTAVTDPEGNKALPGTTTYYAAGALGYWAVQHYANGIQLWTATTMAGPWTAGTAQVAMIKGTGPYWQLYLAGTAIAISGPLTTPLALVDPVAGGGTPESQHVATLAGAWTAVEDLEYKMGTDDMVGVSGELTIPAAPGNPSTITTLPGAYCPSRTEFLSAIENAGAPFTGIPHVCQVTTTGVVGVYGALTPGNTLRIFGSYPVDTF